MKDLADLLYEVQGKEDLLRILEQFAINPAATSAWTVRPEIPGQLAPKPKYHVPGPYEIALAAGCALISANKHETAGAALQAGWAAVPDFFLGRDFYLSELAPAVFRPIDEIEAYRAAERGEAQAHANAE
jgi:hypothetical protein